MQNNFRKLNLAWTFLVLASVSISGCSTAGKNGDSSAGASSDTSRIDITYVLGQSHYQIHFESRNGVASGRSLVDHETVKDTQIASDKYAHYLRKITDFTAAPHRIPAQAATCRSPFLVTLGSSDGDHSVSGCRTAEEKDFSQLVQEGEFLLCSKKP